MPATKPFRVAYVDVDNTIVEQGSNHVAPHRLGQLRALKIAGYMIILFTARPVHPQALWIREFIQQEVPFDHIMQKMLADSFIVIDDCLGGGFTNMEDAVAHVREEVK